MGGIGIKYSPFLFSQILISQNTIECYISGAAESFEKWYGNGNKRLPSIHTHMHVCSFLCSFFCVLCIVIIFN